MKIEQLLQKHGGETDENLLAMILGNRIDHGSSEGGLVSVKQFSTLAQDILVWKRFKDADALKETVSKRTLPRNSQG